MSRWILIGGAGFTGLKIAEDLIDRKVPNSKIVIADLKDALIKVSLKVTKVSCDISKNILPQFEENDIIIHLAARQYHLKIPYKNKLSWFRSVNVAGTKNIINSCMKYKVKGLVFFSTDMIYGLPKFTPVTTNHPKNPIGPYGKSKLEAEELCYSARKKGLPITILRPRLIMGPGRLGIMKKLFISIFKGIPVPLIGNGKNCYQMVSVGDCSEAAILAVKKQFPNYELNLGSKIGPDVKSLLNSLIIKVNSKSILMPIPALPIKIILSFFEKIGWPILHKEQYKIADKNYIVDISDTYSKIGWKPKLSDKDMIIAAYNYWINIK